MINVSDQFPPPFAGEVDAALAASGGGRPLSSRTGPHPAPAAPTSPALRGREG